MSRSKNIFIIKDLSTKIKSDPYNQDLKIERGFIFLKKKNYKKAIYDFSTVIRCHDYVKNISGRSNRLFLEKNKLYKIYLFRSFAYALYGEREKSCCDYDYLVRSDCNIEYCHLVLFLWIVLDRRNELAKFRYQYSFFKKEFSEFEQDLFNLIPINNIEGLNELIKLINFSLGIIRKNRN